jgi:hypothetical protein
MLTLFLPQQYCCTLRSVLLYNAFGSTRQEYNRNLVLIILINYCLYFMKCLPYQKYVEGVFGDCVEKVSQGHTYLLTYLLTPWSRVLLEKLTGCS